MMIDLKSVSDNGVKRTVSKDVKSSTDLLNLLDDFFRASVQLPDNYRLALVTTTPQPQTPTSDDEDTHDPRRN